ncbi:MAG: hypothetical protein ACLFPR_01760 [Desulfococcaceae bacterium]
MMVDLYVGESWVLETRPPEETDGPLLRTIVQRDADCVVWASPEALARPDLCRAHLEGMARSVAAVRRFRRTVRWSLFGARWAAAAVAAVSCRAGVVDLLRGQAPWALVWLLAAAPGFFLRHLIRWSIGRRLKRR